MGARAACGTLAGSTSGSWTSIHSGRPTRTTLSTVAGSDRAIGCTEPTIPGSPEVTAARWARLSQPWRCGSAGRGVRLIAFARRVVWRESKPSKQLILVSRKAEMPSRPDTAPHGRCGESAHLWRISGLGVVPARALLRCQLGSPLHAKSSRTLPLPAGASADRTRGCALAVRPHRNWRLGRAGFPQPQG